MAWFIRLIPFCSDGALEIIFTFIGAVAVSWVAHCLPLSESRMGVSHVNARPARTFGISPKQAFLGAMLRFGIGNDRKSPRRRDAVASTRDECATPKLLYVAGEIDTLLAGACAMKCKFPCSLAGAA